MNDSFLFNRLMEKAQQFEKENEKATRPKSKSPKPAKSGKTKKQDKKLTTKKKKKKTKIVQNIIVSDSGDREPETISPIDDGSEPSMPGEDSDFEQYDQI